MCDKTVAVGSVKDTKYEIQTSDGVDVVSMKSGSGCPAFDLN